MRYLIVDLEAACWNSSSNRDRMEIIVIGAVEMLSPAGPHHRGIDGARNIARPAALVQPGLEASGVVAFL